MHSYKIKQLYIYPIKSMRGIAIDESEVGLKGLNYDRQWMLMDNESGRFLSQRNFPHMALLTPSIADGKVTITDADGTSLTFDIDECDTSQTYDATVWNDAMQVYEVSQSASAWCSKALNTDCKLVMMTNDYGRNKSLDDSSRSIPMNFPDGYPILVLGSASMDHLQSLCSEDIAIDRFRPNIIVETLVPHEEDEWQELRSDTDASLALKVIKPCIRCQMINIDQASALSNLEPTRTLATYRLTERGIAFGANTICVSQGNLKKGDTIVFD
jgi:uncharacterized protein